MIRPVVTRARPRLVTALLAGLVTVLPGFAPAPALADQVPPVPLRVTIDTLNPAAVPRHGPVTISGRITNVSEQTWTHLQVFMFTSQDPITSPADLAAADQTPGNAYVGNRLTGSGLYQQVGDLAPGQSENYLVSVPRRDLQISGRPGVYWFGIHVLGTQNGFRDAVADGRARTFLPLLPAHGPHTQLALVMPIETAVRRDRHGRLLDPAGWRGELRPDGRLSRLLALSGGTDQPFTWVLDPAVLDAVGSMVRGNPGYDITPRRVAGASPSPSPSSSPSTSPSGSTQSPSQSTTGSPSGSVTVPPGSTGSAGGSASPSRRRAQAWLAEISRQAPARQLLTVPYGDLDVAAALAHRHAGLLRHGADLSAASLKGLSLQAGPVVAPGDRSLGGAALARIDPLTTVVLPDTAMPSVHRSAVTTSSGQKVVLTDTEAAAGGPAPGPRFAALAVRQRILSEAALHALSSRSSDPLVVSLPQYWDPGAHWQDASFFAGLNQMWLQLVGLAAVPASTPAGPVLVSKRAVRRELPVPNLEAAHDLFRAGRTFADLLARRNTLAGQVGRSAMLAVSTAARAHPRPARLRARDSIAAIGSRMRRVRIDGPPFVMMSSNQGPIQITLVNGLDQPVKVGISATSLQSDLLVKSPTPITIGPGKRAAVRLSARADDIGVHAVTLRATNAAGRPIGAHAEFTVRTSQVGRVIWVIMAVGGVLLFGAIIVRLAHRVARYRSARRPRPDSEQA